MSARFGRNQRRKMREALAVQAMLTRQASNALASESEARIRMKDRMIREHDEELRAARMARDTIRIDVDSLIDPRERNIQIRARFDNMSKKVDSLYSAINLDSHQDMLRRSDVERAAFVKLVGEQIAQHALEQIMRQWRSR